MDTNLILYNNSDNGKQSRKMFLMRHGERVDYILGDLFKKCFDDKGNYHRKDLNLPVNIPFRKNGPSAYNRDTPVTRVGMFQAQLIGEALANEAIDYVFCSPSFRCVQTCDAFLRGCKKQNKLQIKIEPGLFEHFQWYNDDLPVWLTPQELVKAGFNIDTNYKSLKDEKHLKDAHESYEDFCARNADITKTILNSYSRNIIFFGHCATLEVCSWELVGKKPKPESELRTFLADVTYCAIIELQGSGGIWKTMPSPCPPVTHGGNKTLNYEMFLK